jgi:hypothetical protein
MSKPAKPKSDTSFPTWPPRNEADLLYTQDWLDLHFLMAENVEKWGKPLPPYPAQSEADNLGQEEWIFHTLNDQNFSRLWFAAHVVSDKSRWQRQTTLLALELAEREGNLDKLHTVINDALTTCYGKEYADRVAAAIKLSPKGRHKDPEFTILVEEGARVRGQIELLLKQLQKHHRTRPTKNEFQRSSTEFAVRYLRHERKRVLSDKQAMQLHDKIEVRCRKKAVATDPTHY